VQPTNVSDPNYYHKVVDCQWGCPAHTNVPEYIRLIAQGKYTESYLLNRDCNVFPGILGRTCDRPCEPACRRTRIDGKAVAICRLKRVASDLRGEIDEYLPKPCLKKNGKKVALIGCGPASLTVANDLMPLGYSCTIFEKLDSSGGLMRTNIPRFRLPLAVLDEEIAMIVDQGVEVKYDTPVESMKQLLDSKEFDAVFVGTGAPKGKNLDIPGREKADANIHIGIAWLESVAFGHIDKIGKNVVIIGAGNTAMDCCRTSKRIGGENVYVMARKPRTMLKASPWELEDAEEEQVNLMLNHAPNRFIIEKGKLAAAVFDKVEWHKDDSGRLKSTKLDEVVIPCEDVILAIGQDNAFPWIERDIGIDFNEWDMPTVDKTTFQCSREGVFFGGDAAFGPENIIWAVAHGHQAAISIHNYCHGLPVTKRLPFGMNLTTTKMGLHQWSYSNDYSEDQRQKMVHVNLAKRLKDLNIEVEKGFDIAQTAKEVQRCLNCDIQTHFTDTLCIECDACIDICPVDCLTITENRDETPLRQSLTMPAKNLDQDIYVSLPLPQTGKVMVKDEDICVHCGLCAERCPTAAWDMQKFDLKLPYASEHDV
jgi:formate dehydrogenase (NADP+) beta subunit